MVLDGLIPLATLVDFQTLFLVWGLMGLRGSPFFFVLGNTTEWQLSWTKEKNDRDNLLVEKTQWRGFFFFFLVVKFFFLVLD